MDPRSVSGVASDLGRPANDNTPTIMEYYNNYVIAGTPMSTVAAGSRDACESQCWGKGECAAFSFFVANRRCSLFDAPQNRFPQRGTMSGGKLQPKH
jgi:hypothetical protein